MAVTSRTSKKQTNKKISLEPYFLSRSVYLSCWVSLPSWFFLIVYFLCLGNLRVVVGIMMDLYVSVAQSRPTLCDPMNCSPPDHSVHGILQARIPEWVAISFSRGSSLLRDQTQVSCIAGRFFIVWATREAPSWWTPFTISWKILDILDAKTWILPI